jgi:Tfp pilus assembly protein PilF
LLLIRLALYGLTLCIGVGVVSEVHQSPFGEHPILDEELYVNWARTIAGGEWIGKDVFFFDPLAAYFLAVVFKLTGGSLLAARFIQVLLGVVTVDLVFRTGRRLFGTAAGLLAAGALVLYGPHYFHLSFLLKEGLIIHLTAWALYLGVRALEEPGEGGSRQGGAWWGLGLALGLLCLLRGNFLLLCPMLLGYLLWRVRARLRGYALRLALLGLGLALPLTASLGHNLAAGGQWVLTTSHGGPNFYIGNNARARGSYAAPPFVRAGPKWEEVDFQREAERRLGRALPRSEVSGYWLREGLGFWRQQPLQALGLLVTKVGLIVHDYEIPDNYSFPFLREHFAPTLHWAFLSFGLLFAPAMVGMALSFRSDRRAGFIAVFAVFYAGSVVMFFVLDRYRVPLIPVLCLFSAWGVLQVLAWARAHQWGRLGAGAVAVGGLTALAFVPNSETKAIPMHEARFLHIAGMIWLDAGRAEEALPLLEQSARLAPAANESLYNLGTAYHSQGDLERAERAYRQALQLQPEHAQANLNLGLILLEKKALSESQQHLLRAEQLQLRSASLFGALGETYRQQGQALKAIGYYERALALEPGHPTILRGLVLSLADSGQCEQALTHLRTQAHPEPGLEAALRQRCKTLP